ncbi:MAG: TonB-dependent receptor domain-containing protein [Brevundimonas sp.]
MRTQKIRNRLLATTMIGGIAALAFSAPAMAQSAPQEAELDEVVVTGSRIPVRDNTSSSPISTVQGEVLSEIGTGTIETYLNALPQVQPSLTKTNNNPTGGGSAFLNLRDLGPSRGLVLVNGRRMVPGNSAGSVDVSILPSAIIERVELITGGASAVYGADAVSGVVNFQLRDRFEGLEMSAQYGISEEGDGEEYALNLLAGAQTADGRGRVVFAASYNNRALIAQSAREFSQTAEYCLVSGCTPNGSTTTGDGTFSIPGNATAAQLTVFRDYFIAQGVPVATANSVIRTGQRIGFNPDGSLFIAGRGRGLGDGVWNYSGPNTSGYDPADFYGENFNPVNLLQSPFERYNFYTSFGYDLTDRIEFYGNALYSGYDSQNDLAESPAQFVVNVATNSTLPTEARTVLQAAGISSFALARRTNELGPRTYESATDAFSLTGGIRGKLPEFNGYEWNYDAYATFGEYRNVFTYGGFPHGERINAALNGCPAGSPAGPFGSNGQISPCVPFNPFGRGSITAAQRAYIEAKGQTAATTIQMTDVQATVSGNIFDLPAGPVGFALGGEYRNIDYDFLPGEAIQTGNLLGGNASGPVAGAISVNEIFAELRVPLLAEVPFFDYLGLEGGYRVSDYSTGSSSFTTDTFKYGGEWQPVEGVRFRALQQRAVRAPSVGELFATRAEGYPSATDNQDPCDVDNAARSTGPNAGAITALCAAQNAAAGAAGFQQSGSQFRIFSGGNTALTPEVADSFTAGVVLTAPSFFPNWASSLTASIDYWDIEIENVISAVGFSTSLSRCYNPLYNPTFTTANSYCQAITRDPTTGQVTSVGLAGSISQQNANLAELIASGVDISLAYRLDPTVFGWSEGLGQFQFTTTATWYENQQVTSLPGDAISDNQVGSVGDGTPNNGTLPEWKVSTRIAWQKDDFALSLRWQFIDSVEDFAATDANGFIPGIDAYNYFFLNGSWQVNDTVQFYGGIDNLTDEAPPIYTRGFQYNTDPSTYDVIGRYYYVGIRSRF